jgi:hypothetical protein
MATLTKKRKVYFNQSVKLRVYDVPTKRDVEAAWYSRNDFRGFLKERSQHMHMIRKMGIEQAENRAATSIGIRLQLYPPKKHWRGLRQTSRCYLVLREQNQQYLKCINDPEAIAGVCKHISDMCSKEALEEALRLQETSKQIYDEISFEGTTWIPPSPSIDRMESVEKELPLSFCMRHMHSSAAAILL